MSKSWKNVLISGVSLLMLSSVGAGMSSVHTNAHADSDNSWFIEDAVDHPNENKAEKESEKEDIKRADQNEEEDPRAYSSQVDAGLGDGTKVPAEPSTAKETTSVINHANEAPKTVHGKTVAKHHVQKRIHSHKSKKAMRKVRNHRAHKATRSRRNRRRKLNRRKHRLHKSVSHRRRTRRTKRSKRARARKFTRRHHSKHNAHTMRTKA